MTKKYYLGKKTYILEKKLHLLNKNIYLGKKKFKEKNFTLNLINNYKIYEFFF